MKTWKHLPNTECTWNCLKMDFTVAHQELQESTIVGQGPFNQANNVGFSHFNESNNGHETKFPKQLKAYPLAL